MKSKVSPAIFIASLLCFLFPFVTVSCGGQKVASFSGMQLATGTTVEQPQMLGPPQKQTVVPDPTAAIAALCAILGLVLSLLSRRIAIAPAICGAIGALSLLVMKSRLDDRVVEQGHGMFQVNYESGFSFALLLFVAGAAWNGYVYSQRKEIRAAPLAETPGAHVTSFPQQFTCPNCGQPWTLNAKFCMHCGKQASNSMASGRASSG